MKSIVACLVGMLALSGVAQAQTSAAGSGDAKGYIAGVAQAAFGNVTSQSYGAEGGWFLSRNVAIFAEFGWVRDTAPASLGADAQIIAGYLTQVQSAPVSYSARQPVVFGQAGIRYAWPTAGKFQPYVLAGAGVGGVQKDVTFTVGGSDVTDHLGDYGVTLGSDLSGTTTDAMFTAGGGVAYKVGTRWQFDFGYRYSRIFTDTAGTNVNRAGLGLGFRF